MPPFHQKSVAANSGAFIIRATHMKKILLLTLALFVSLSAEAADTRLFELRTYYANDGKLKALHARFRDHTLKLFEKHGMTNLGYWTPDENKNTTLTYVLAYPDMDARKKAWRGFLNDPDWKAAYKASTANGKLVKRIDRVFMKATDYSPAISARAAGSARSFQLRTYTTNEDKLDDLHARFRDHTVGLFEKHGIENVAYWIPTEKKNGSDNTLIYFIAGESPAAITGSFRKFGKDPAWQKARKASEVNGRLTRKVVGVFMTPTDYSPTR